MSRPASLNAHERRLTCANRFLIPIAPTDRIDRGDVTGLTPGATTPL